MHSSSLMRRDWDERARSDAFYYIAWPGQWDEETFFKSGERDYQSFVKPVLAMLGLSPNGGVVLDVGCGVGRLTHCFSERFRHVYALDVSAEMLRQGRMFLGDRDNITWVLGDGQDLSMFKNETVDFVFSYLVLQHLPEKEESLNLISEMLRVLKVGGAFLFQFNSYPLPTMNRRGRIVSALVDRLRGAPRGRAALEWGNGVLPNVFRVDPLAAGKTWRGAVLKCQEVLRQVWGCGGIVAGVEAWGSQYTWCYGKKGDG